MPWSNSCSGSAITCWGYRTHSRPRARRPSRSAWASGYTGWARDLDAAPDAAWRLAEWLASQARSDRALINNAAASSDPAPLRVGALENLRRDVRVGLEAPLPLILASLRATAGSTTDRRILNISSSLGRRAMAGSASYRAG